MNQGFAFLGLCLFMLVPGAGIEPAQPCGHWCLRPARLPIPPSGPCLKWEANVVYFFYLGNISFQSSCGT